MEIQYPSTQIKNRIIEQQQYCSCNITNECCQQNEKQILNTKSGTKSQVSVSTLNSSPNQQMSLQRHQSYELRCVELPIQKKTLSLQVVIDQNNFKYQRKLSVEGVICNTQSRQSSQITQIKCQQAQKYKRNHSQNAHIIQNCYFGSQDQQIIFTSRKKIKTQQNSKKTQFTQKQIQKCVQNSKIQQKFKTKQSSRNNQEPNLILQTILTQKPRSQYSVCREALYTFMRNLVHQGNMSLQVFAMTMVYLDLYFQKYNNIYKSQNFMLIAYSLIIISSKMVNRTILTPRLLASKTGIKEHLLKDKEMELIRIFGWETYFVTFVKRQQVYTQRWQQICEHKGLIKQLGIFQQNANSFVRYCRLNKQVEKYAKVKNQVTIQQFAKCFTRAFLSQITKLKISKQEFICMLQHTLFNPQYNLQYNTTCKQSFKINLSQILSCEQKNLKQQYCTKQQISMLEESFNNQYKQPTKYPCYSIFLNSILQIEL